MVAAEKTKQKIDWVPIEELVLDFTLYLRTDVDSVHVHDLVECLRAGMRLPPIIADKKSKRVSDGFHRLAAYKQLKRDRILVSWRDYPDDAALYLDAVNENAGHGRKLSPYDRTRIIVRAEELRLEPTLIAKALRLSPERVEEIRLHRTAIGPAAQIIPLKHTARHLAGQEITQNQIVGIQQAGGFRAIYYARQLMNALERDLIEEGDEETVAVLHTLSAMLKARFGEILLDARVS